MAPSVNLASPRLSADAKAVVKSAIKAKAKAKAEAKSLWVKTFDAAMGQSLLGSVKSEFDSKSSFGVLCGIPDAEVLVRLRDKILNSAAIELQGVHTPKGVGNVFFAKAIVAAIAKLGDKDARDKEAKPLCTLAWRRCSTLFALVRDTNGTFDTSTFSGKKVSK